MKKYAFRVYRGAKLTDVLVCGSVSANSMEEAAINVIKQNSIIVYENDVNGFKEYRLRRHGEIVGMYIYPNLAYIYKYCPNDKTVKGK
jgi:hypothetical protein